MAATVQPRVARTICPRVAADAERRQPRAGRRERRLIWRWLQLAYAWVSVSDRWTGKEMSSYQRQRENERVAKQPLAQKPKAALERAPAADAPSKIIQIATELKIWGGTMAQRPENRTGRGGRE